MSEIANLCNAIMSHLSKLGLHTPKNMLPGPTQDKISQLTAGLPFQLPQSAFELYQWSEGLRPKTGVGNDFIPGYAMNSLTEMISMYQELSQAADYPRFHSGNLHWFPLLKSGGTDFYGICCAPGPTDDGQIVDDDNEGEHRDNVTPPVISFAGLVPMLRTVAKCLETGVYYINKQGQLSVGIVTYDKKGRLLNVDRSAFRQVVAEFNPGL
jgi:cell wall assembly regulator SMI1